jgi:hypothetical protein
VHTYFQGFVGIYLGAIMMLATMFGLFFKVYEGYYCWGRRPSETSPTSGQADGLGTHVVSVTRKDFCTMGLTETLMLLMSRELCCAGMVLHGSASLRHRRHRWRCSSTRVRESQKHCAPTVNIASGASNGTGRMSGKVRHDRSWIL